ncbi:MAG: TolC family protein [Bacillota bacterium]
MNKIFDFKPFKTSLFIIITLTLIIISSFSISAQELLIEEAIENGKENNFELEEKHQAVKDIERERDLLEAGIDWYINFDGDYSYNSDGPSFNSPQIVESGDDLSLSLKGGKTTISGLSISSELSLIEPEPFGFEDLDKKYQFSLQVSKRLYPILPTETEKQFIQTDNKLIIAEEELSSMEKEKEIDWLESFLNVLRMQQRLEYSNESYQLASDNLYDVKAQVEIGEAGQEQLLMAEINLREARLQKEQLQTGLVQAKDKFEMELGLENNDFNYSYQDNDSYISQIMNRAESINIEYSTGEIEDMLKKNNVQLLQIELNRDYAENQLKWQMKDDDVKVDSFGGYQYNPGSPTDDNDNWQVGIGVSYDFYDGGQQELKVEGIEDRIVNLEKQYNHSLKQLKLQLQGMMDEYKINKMKQESAMTALEKARLEEELYQKQYDQGLITEDVYKQKVLAVRQAEVEYEAAVSQVLIDKLRIALFLGEY